MTFRLPKYVIKRVAWYPILGLFVIRATYEQVNCRTKLAKVEFISNRQWDEDSRVK
jgi:hypothetical protein